MKYVRVSTQLTEAMNVKARRLASKASVPLSDWIRELIADATGMQGGPLPKGMAAMLPEDQQRIAAMGGAAKARIE